MSVNTTRKKPKNRVDRVKNKYGLNNDLLELLSYEDPSGNNKYLEWMCQQIKMWTRSRDVNNVIIIDIINTVKKFHKFHRRLTGKHVYQVLRRHRYPLYELNFIFNHRSNEVLNSMDINAYKCFKTLKLLMVDIENTFPTDREVRGERIVLFDNELLRGIVPLTRRASIKYGSNTKWCTASSHTMNYFERYTKKGNGLIYFEFKDNLKYDRWQKVALYWQIGKLGDLSLSCFDVLDTHCLYDEFITIIGDVYRKQSPNSLDIDKLDAKFFYMKKDLKKTIYNHIIKHSKLNIFKRIMFRIVN